MSNAPKTQEERVLEALQNADGQWVSGQHFLRAMMLSQFHARIFSLQKKGHDIEPSDFKDEFGFKSYRLMPKLPQQTLL